jgi:glutathione synthase/RimK-type ligase-like ATP-grasp enzyme
MSEKLVEISQHLAPLTYLGYDIAITDDGFKIIDINSHQGIRMFQVYGPLLRENIAADYFNYHLESIKKRK